MSPMWQTIARASPPASVIRCATAAQASALRLETTTFAPRSANALAIASPIPRLAPVTTATLPFRSNMSVIRFAPSALQAGARSGPEVTGRLEFSVS